MTTEIFSGVSLCVLFVLEGVWGKGIKRRSSGPLRSSTVVGEGTGGRTAGHERGVTGEEETTGSRRRPEKLEKVKSPSSLGCGRIY